MGSRVLTIAASLALLILTATGSASATATGWAPARLPRHQTPQAVACTSTRWCQAAGGYDQALTAARWTGRRWVSEAAAPRPRGVVSASFSAVTCRSTRDCEAVGVGTGRPIAPERPLAERWNGRAWIVQHAPAAPGDPDEGLVATNSQLNGVACPGRRLCFAVGQQVAFGAGKATPPGPLIESWNGSRWSIHDGDEDADGALRAVSCTSPRACSAVGDDGTIEAWNGSSWSVQPISGSASVSSADLRGVSCTSSRACMAVGSAGGQPVVVSWNGAVWSAQALSTPLRATLDAVACQTSAFCIAVGGWMAAGRDTSPLGEVWNGVRWKTTILHRGTARLKAVSCPALGWCVAVGDGIAERWIG